MSDTNKKKTFAAFRSQPITFPSPPTLPALPTRVGQQRMSRANGAPDFPSHSFMGSYIWSKTSNTQRKFPHISLQSEQLLYACQQDLVLKLQQGKLLFGKFHLLPLHRNSNRNYSQAVLVQQPNSDYQLSLQGRVLAGWAPHTINYRKRQQEKNFHLSHYDITSAAVSTAPMVLTFQAAETQEEA